MTLSGTTTVPVKKIAGRNVQSTTDQVVREVPVTLFLNDEELVTLVCSPDHLEELAVGFLCSEGILRKPGDLKGITVHRDDGLIWVETTGPAPAREGFLKRYLTTCCGRSRSSFYFINDARGIKPVTSPLQIPLERALAFAREMEGKAALFRATGGSHGAALYSREKALFFYEDIGRHNAVDKIFGRAFLDGIALGDKLLVFSGRVSSEILIKVARMGIPVIIARGAPTDLALAMARETGITVAGFARGDRMNVYTHSERIIV
ncbi:formate dehydrogenase accessory sulfurtransferase FdhD [Desulfofundulus thermobenzoicus]|uniref:Sulfur carrier protein FdhD n=1 Tax=Desulfofundulus thermobenzoicus TaxID=29376 RepID=A0A6N7IME8_9FIRM|nr:formate dehydrogenase accessory sulfurtransferase FdhD [Desulfofundulus thermobenzoicus]MQL51150.1 formate dehydrogenase accessory sulfurtransferase FdhD [Desulfofundulus thermobenzoicus]